MTGAPLQLLPHHLAELQASAIPADLAIANVASWGLGTLRHWEDERAEVVRHARLRIQTASTVGNGDQEWRHSAGVRCAVCSQSRTPVVVAGRSWGHSLAPSVDMVPVRQVPSGRTYLAQMGTAATAARHPLGTAPPRSIGRQGFRADS